MTDKEKQVVAQLIEKTRSRKVSWEPTAETDEFVAAFRGRVTFTIRRSDGSAPPKGFMEGVMGFVDSSFYEFTIRDDQEREVLLLIGSVLADLYQAARDSALRTDETLDAVLHDLQAS